MTKTGTGAGEDFVLRIWRKKGFFKEKGRGVNQKNHNGLRGFSILIGGWP
jgi:hypothetical protein